MSGVIWALVIMKGSALAPHLEMLGYVMTGVVAFLMCIRAKHLLLSFVPGTFMGACATFAGQGTGSWWFLPGAGAAVWLRHEEQRSLAGGATGKTQNITAVSE